MRRRFWTLVSNVAVMIIAAVLAAPQAFAWGNGGYSSNPEYPDYGTHDWIADKALAFQTADVTFLLTTYHADYLLGTEAPDNDAYIGDSYNHHVYYRASGELQTDVGSARAREMYQSALASLKSSDFEHAAYYAGAMAHYISDVGAYGHTMGASTDWGPSPHHEDYEDHVHTMLGSLAAPQATAIPWNDAYNATLSLARTTTFGSGTIKTNSWMETNYDWANPVFRSSCIESLNESVRAVASALGLLLSQAGGYPVPEFHSAGFLVLAMAVIPLALCWRRRRASLAEAPTPQSASRAQ